MTVPDDSVLDRKVKSALLSPSLRAHLFVVGAALFAVGAVVLWLLPDLSLWWALVAVIVVSHAGLLMVAGAAVLRWIASGRGEG